MTVHAQPDVTARMAVIRLVAVIRHVTRPDSTDSVELILICLRWDFLHSFQSDQTEIQHTCHGAYYLTRALKILRGPETDILTRF